MAQLAMAPALAIPAMRPDPPERGSAFAARPARDLAGRVFLLNRACGRCGSRWWWCTWEHRRYGFCLSCWNCAANLFFQRDGRAYIPERLPSGIPGRPPGGRPGVPSWLAGS